MSKNEITSINQSFLENVSEVLAQARKNAKTAVNLAMVYAYYEIGRMIVEEEQNTDFLPDLGERLENGSMAGESGGHYCDPLIAFMMVYNAIKGNYTDFAGKFEDVPFPYLYVSSADDYKAYEQYFVDQLPYTDEELVAMSELDLAGLKEAAAKVSIEDAAARAGK